MEPNDTVYEALNALGIAWRTHTFCDGSLLFCEGDEGTFNILRKEDGTLRLWRFVEPDAHADPTLQRVEYRLPDGTGSVFGYELTEDGDLNVYYQTDLSGNEDPAEITKLIRLFLSLSARMSAAGA